MSRFSCVIQEHGAAHERTHELEQRLAEHHGQAYPGESADVTWIVVAPGYMFTEGRPSTSSVISCRIDDETTLSAREAYMRAVCDIWTEVTGCTDHEVVVSLTDASSTTE